jgi:hypothetical protein
MSCGICLNYLSKKSSIAVDITEGSALLERDAASGDVWNNRRASEIRGTTDSKDTAPHYIKFELSATAV